MGKLAPSEVDRRGMAVLRETQALRRQSLRGLAAVTFDDLRLGAVLDALQPDDGAVLDAWEEFVWRVVSARRLRERADRRRNADAYERARTDGEVRADERRGEEWDRGRPLHRERGARTEPYPANVPRTHREDRWVPFSDWLRDPASAATGGHNDDPPDPWMSLHLDPLGSFWRDPWRDGRAGHTPPAEGGGSVAIQREPTPAPGPAVVAAAAAASAGPSSRWSPPLPFERRSPPHGPQFVFDEPPDRYTFVEDVGGVQVIDLSRRAAAREAASGSGGTAPRFHRERHGVLLPGARSPSPGPRPIRRDARPPTTTAGDASRWLDEWSATQPLLGRRQRDASPSHTLRRVRARLDSARDAYGRDTRRDGIVFPDNIDFSGAGDGDDAEALPTPRTALRDASPLVSGTPPVGGEDMRRAGVAAPAWTSLDADARTPAPARHAEPPTALEPALPPTESVPGVLSPTATPPPTRAPPAGSADDDVVGQTSQLSPNTSPSTTPTTSAVTPAGDAPRDRPVAPLPRRPVSMLRAD